MESGRPRNTTPRRAGAYGILASAWCPYPMKPPPQPLRAASYNIRVDHTDDHGTVHDWPYRRALVTSSIVALRADVIGLQEPSFTQAAHLQFDLGPAWGVAVAACDPEAWRAAGPAGPAEGQKRDGNGVAWRRDRLRLLSMDDFALPSDSPFKRSCVVARLRDRASGCELSLLSAHFDHEGADVLGRGSAARRASAALVMARARAELERGGGGARAVLVTGDCTPPPSSNPRLATTSSLHSIRTHCNPPSPARAPTRAPAPTSASPLPPALAPHARALLHSQHLSRPPRRLLPCAGRGGRRHAARCARRRRRDRD